MEVADSRKNALDDYPESSPTVNKAGLDELAMNMLLISEIL